MAKLQPLKIGELTAPIPVIQGGMGVGISLSGLAGAGCGQQNKNCAHCVQLEICTGDSAVLAEKV